MARAWVFRDNVSTDYIIPGRFNITINPDELRRHAFKYVRPEFAGTVAVNDVVIGGRNFGCGSSREHAAIVLKACGVWVVAESFGWIFKRNCINTGVLPLEAVDGLNVEDGSSVTLDLTQYLLTDVSGGQTYRLKPPSRFVQEVYAAGGLISYLNSGKPYSF